MCATTGSAIELSDCEFCADHDVEVRLVVIIDADGSRRAPAAICTSCSFDLDNAHDHEFI